MTGQLIECPGCPNLVHRFTIQGTDHLAPQPCPTSLVGEYLADGWTVTYHDHERTI